MRATTGAPPVPVPPPIPAVIKTISAPIRCSRSSSSLSKVERFPTSGFAPAPSPLVRELPSCTLLCARLTRKACASVLAAMKSAPIKPAAIMVLTALPPAPPMPTMRICALFPFSSTNSNILHLLLTSLLIPSLPRGLLTLKKVTNPFHHSPPHPVPAISATRAGHSIELRVLYLAQGQAYAGGIHG